MTHHDTTTDQGAGPQLCTCESCGPNCDCTTCTCEKCTCASCSH